MMLQTFKSQTLTSLSFWYMLFQQQAIIADSEFAKRACKSRTVFSENYLYWQIILALVTCNNPVEI